MDKIIATFRKYYKSDGYVEIKLQSTTPLDSSYASSIELVKMLWDIERAINENGKVRCYFFIEENK